MGRACACLCLCSGVCAPRYTGYTRYTMYKVHGVSLRNWRETGSSRGGGGNADFYLMGKQKPQWVLEPARVREGRQCDPPRGRDLYWARFGSASAALNTLIRARALSSSLFLSLVFTCDSCNVIAKTMRTAAAVAVIYANLCAIKSGAGHLTRCCPWTLWANFQGIHRLQLHYLFSFFFFFGFSLFFSMLSVIACTWRKRIEKDLRESKKSMRFRRVFCAFFSFAWVSSLSACTLSLSFITLWFVKAVNWRPLMRAAPWRVWESVRASEREWESSSRLATLWQIKWRSPNELNSHLVRENWQKKVLKSRTKHTHAHSHTKGATKTIFQHTHTHSHTHTRIIKKCRKNAAEKREKKTNLF